MNFIHNARITDTRPQQALDGRREKMTSQQKKMLRALDNSNRPLHWDINVIGMFGAAHLRCRECAVL
jgi:hypothetical protein